MREDYDIATSTFEWYRDSQTHHSRDLVRWRLAARPLDRAGLLDMRGNPADDRFDGILLQEGNPERGLLGEPVDIFPGIERGLTEGPHLFQRGGWYPPTVAEGGTG